MASLTLHIRKVETLPSGEHNLQVSVGETYFPQHGNPAGKTNLFDSVILPAGTKNVERLLDAAILNESAGVWLATHGGDWDKELVREYLEQILEK